MQHTDVREALELAAVEPSGIDRLMAGDTPEAAAVAGHLAGCLTCLEELTRLRRSETILREVIAIEPPSELRERTLAFVRELGVPRGDQKAGIAQSADGSIDLLARPAPTDLGRRRRSLARPVAWLASIAVAIVLSVVATTMLLGGRADEDAAALARVASWTVDIGREPDARQVILTGSGGGPMPARGQLSYAPSTNGLVVVARGLAAAPTGKEYRCWLESADGTRTRIGRMAFAYGLFYWVGDVPALSSVAPGTRFGVSLTDFGAGSSVGPANDQPVLVGQL
jgi:hypothetical protein